MNEKGKACNAAYDHRLSDAVFVTKEESDRIDAERERFNAGLDLGLEYEWNLMSRKIIVKNQTALETGAALPWDEILVYAPEESKPLFRMTQMTWFMTGIREGYDRLSYEPFTGKAYVTVWKNRMEIAAHGTRKQRKKRKKMCIQNIARLLSQYYNTEAKIYWKRCCNAYIVKLEKRSAVR